MTDDLRSFSSASADSPACARVDAALADYLEGELPTGERVVLEAHAAECARCGALIADLHGLSAEAAALPVLRPERDLWAGIAARIEAPVVPLSSAPSPALRNAQVDRRAEPRARTTVAVSRRWLAAAAAVLVASTAGATYLATRGTGDLAPTVAVAPTTPVAPPTDPSPLDPTPSAPAPPPVVATVTQPATARESAAPTALAAPSARLVARRDARRSIDATVPGAVAYDSAIATLRTAVGARRQDLDSSTVAILERNLRIIDAAILQSRQALARDPGSAFLGRALTNALDRKLELLRTVAMLPRT